MDPLTEQEREEKKIVIPFSRVMKPEDRELPYRSRRFESSKALHWGQRKLLLSEVEFLTDHGHRSDTVLYLGAADGMHIPLLVGLFPHHRFILYDPQPFHSKMEEIIFNPLVEIHRKLFQDEDVVKYANRGVLLISDIRIVPESYNDMRKNRRNETMEDLCVNHEIEEYVKQDMDAQMSWHLELNPAASMMKFRLPYKAGTTTYLKGEVHYQAWAPSTSTECRLIVVGNEMCDYDHTEYERKMYRFNLCTRLQKFDLPIEVPRVHPGYDLAAELYIFSRYFEVVQKKDPEKIPGFLRGLEVTLTKYFEKTLEDKYEEARAYLCKRIETAKRNTLFGPSRGRGTNAPSRGSKKPREASKRTEDPNPAILAGREDMPTKRFGNWDHREVTKFDWDTRDSVDRSRERYSSSAAASVESIPKPPVINRATKTIKVTGTIKKK
jgi:hypothetical protein